MSEQPLIDEVEAAYVPLRDALARLRDDGMERPTSGGWTAKEMAAHVAFWQEAVRPVVTTMLRDGEPPEGGFVFGSGYVPGDEWPDADTHNAREAAWAREQTPAVVLARLDAAHADLLDVLGTITDDERLEHAVYLAGVVDHFREHLAELEP